MRVTVIGAGNWGSRVAARLREMPDAYISGIYDPDHARAEHVSRSLDLGPAVADLRGHLEAMQPQGVVIATPPSTHVSLAQQAIACGVRSVRIEKPLAPTVTECMHLEALARRAGATITVGFTLLYHPLYQFARAYVLGHGGAVGVTGMRIGAAPAHEVCPRIDLGVHTASIAADLCAPLDELIAAHHPQLQARTTTIRLRSGGSVVVDEIEHTVRTPTGVVTLRTAEHDALGDDLEAWMQGTNRGTVAVATAAQRMLTRMTVRTEAAA